MTEPNRNESAVGQLSRESNHSEFRVMAGQHAIGIAFPDQEQVVVGETVEDMMGILMSSRLPKRTNDTTWQNALATCVCVLRGEPDLIKARNTFLAAAVAAGLQEPGDRLRNCQRTTVKADRSRTVETGQSPPSQTVCQIIGDRTSPVDFTVVQA